MKENYAINLLKKMIEIYSPSRKEKEIAFFLKKELEKLNFDRVWMDKVNNIYGRIGSESPILLLCGHLDTVKGKIPVEIRQNKIFGRGAVDAKSPLASMICAAKNFTNNKFKGSIIVAGIVEEEYHSKGIKQLINEKIKVDYAIFGEPSGIQNITFAYKGKLTYKVIIKTDTAHVGQKHLVDNAIEKTFELWQLFENTFKNYRSKNGVFYSLVGALIKITSTRTSGGVPDLCEMNVDLRLPPTISCLKGLEIVNLTIKNFLKKYDKKISLKLKILDQIEPFIANRKTLLMKALETSIMKITGKSIHFLRKTGTGDMNIFGKVMAIPVATYGPGDGRLSHTNQEYIDVSEYINSIKILGETIKYIFYFQNKL